MKPKKHSSSFLKELFKTKPLAGLGLIVLILLVLVAIFADVLAPYPMVDGQMTTSVIDKLEDPFFLLDAEEKAEAIEKGKVFLLGTDGLGRDLLSYLIYGARTSVILCIACTILSTIISTIIGVSSAVLGGGYDPTDPAPGGRLAVYSLHADPADPHGAPGQRYASDDHCHLGAGRHWPVPALSGPRP